MAWCRCRNATRCCVSAASPFTSPFIHSAKLRSATGGTCPPTRHGTFVEVSAHVALVGRGVLDGTAIDGLHEAVVEAVRDCRAVVCWRSRGRGRLQGADTGLLSWLRQYGRLQDVLAQVGNVHTPGVTL